MRMKFVLAALLALPLMVAALIYGRSLTRCHHIDSASATAENSDKSACYPSDKSACCQQEDNADTPKQTTVSRE